MEKDEKDRKYKLSLRFVPARRVIENFKKIAKKFKKLKNSIMGRFQAKIVSKTKRKREKNLLFHSVPTQHVIENSKKSSKKIQKN